MFEQIMNLNTEQLDEFLGDAFDDDEVEAEADEIVQETLLGIGIDLAAAMADAPTSKPASAHQLATGNTDTAESKAAADMEARFAALTAS